MSPFHSSIQFLGASPNLTLRELEIQTKPKLDPDLLQQAQSYPEVEQQVILHCRHHPGIFFPYQVRIWPSTYLKAKDSSHVARLIHAFNISYYPEWMSISHLKPHEFTLIFEGLPKDCLVFDLVEDIPEPAGFYVGSISRNSSDVYHVEV